MIRYFSRLQVHVNVIDVNDNKPEFVFTPPYSDFTHSTYYAFVSENAPISSTVLHVTVSDVKSSWKKAILL